MDGLEAAELKLSRIKDDNLTFRFDSEYFKKGYLHIEDNIKSKNFRRLIDLSVRITDFGAFSQNNFINYFDLGTYAFIRNQDVEDMYISDEKIYISNDTYNRLTLKLDEHDLLLQRTGSIGKTGIVLKKDLPSSANQNLAQVKLNLNEINPYYVNAFLNSKVGLKSFERLATGNVQPWLNLGQIGNIKIPIFSSNLQHKIASFVKLIHNKQNETKSLHKQAEMILLKELALLNYKPSKENIAIKSLSESFGESGRLDSEYYQPKYDELIERVKKYKGGYETLNHFSDGYSTGYPFKSNSYVDEGISLIRINNIKKGYLELSNVANIPFVDKNLSVKDIVKENDILISMSGTIGNSCKIPKGVSAVINQRIMKITPKNIGYDLLPLLINSIVGQSQLERIGAGGVQTNISSGDILNILIPKIPTEIEIQIEEKIKESFKLKAESKQLLELAKQAIEVAIETNEEEALKLLEAYEV